MYRLSCRIVGLAFILALAGGVAAQQHLQHHPGGTRPSREPPAEPSPGASEQPPMDKGMQGMMGRSGRMGRRGTDEGDGESAARSGMMGHRGMMGMGGMLQHHLERLAQQLELTDDQRVQVRTLLSNHAKEVIRLEADIAVIAVDVRQLLATEPVDLPKVKQWLQGMATKEADLRFTHVTLMQEIGKLLTPEQQQKFRTMRENMMDRGMLGMGSMMGHGGMMGHGRSRQ